MKYEIHHETHYRFTSDVFPEPHTLRFRPKATPSGNLTSFQLAVVPDPAGISDVTDAEDNRIHLCWFNEMTDRISIHARSVYETRDVNPFNFMLYPIAGPGLPYTYPAEDLPILSACLAGPMIEPDLLHYGEVRWQSSQNEVISFLMELTRAIHKDFTVDYREEGAPHPPSVTFGARRGSCRDLAWMQISLLRAMGFAARFVSGYFYLKMDTPSYELHGWVEVYLPGAGWRGFDPTHGIATGSNHIPLASSSHFENTMPVTGSIRGDASSSLETQLSIIVID